MKVSRDSLNHTGTIRERSTTPAGLVLIWIALIWVTWAIGLGHAQEPVVDENGAQVLTRGPVHEAFAGVVTFNPEPGVVVSKAPPALIEEVPPEEKPEGDQVTWIPGYWAWDDERSDFLWVSGTWRALPPGREWNVGYWNETTQGYQWVSGYWSDTSTPETTYLPAPPATIEVGANLTAPSDDYGWVPGCWMWNQERYAWRPGYWVEGRADWDWVPAHYVWSPRGYIFVAGFWDYPVERRGVLFAPVYFDPAVYARNDYHYAPVIVIDLGVFSAHLFVRPRYDHYYFGDYYDTRYQQSGFYAAFSFGSGQRGYDPIFARQRWQHRQDRAWAQGVATSFQYRRDNVAARPPRTFAAQRNLNQSAIATAQNRQLVATPLQQLTNRKDGNMRFQAVAPEERQRLALRGQEVQKSREQRRAVEAQPAGATARQTDGVIRPTRVPSSRSPIADQSVNSPQKNQRSPEALPAPQADGQIQPPSEKSNRPAKVERNNSPTNSRQPKSEQTPTRVLSEPVRRQKLVQPAVEPVTSAKPSPSLRRVERKTVIAPQPDVKVYVPKSEKSERRPDVVRSAPTPSPRPAVIERKSVPVPSEPLRRDKPTPLASPTRTQPQVQPIQNINVPSTSERSTPQGPAVSEKKEADAQRPTREKKSKD